MYSHGSLVPFWDNRATDFPKFSSFVACLDQQLLIGAKSIVAVISPDARREKKKPDPMRKLNPF